MHLARAPGQHVQARAGRVRQHVDALGEDLLWEGLQVGASGSKCRGQGKNKAGAGEGEVRH